MDRSQAQETAKKLMEEHRWNDAIELLLKDAAENPEDGWTCLYLGSCFYQLRQTKDAMICFNQARKLMPREATPLSCLGDAALMNEKITMAGEFYLQALKLDPENEFILNKLAKWRSISKQSS